MTKNFDIDFSLEIESGNDAFQEDPTSEVSRILCEIAGKIDSGRFHGACKDINGNTVGRWSLDIEEESDDTELDDEDDEDAEHDEL